MCERVCELRVETVKPMKKRRIVNFGVCSIL